MSIFKRKSFWIVLAIIVIIVVISIIAKSRAPKQEEYNTVKAERQTLLQTVSETGKVVSDPDIELGFQTSGIVGRINYSIGQKVSSQAIIAELESQDQAASVSAAQAALDAAQAALNLKLAGATNQDIDIAKANVAIASVALETAQNDLLSVTKSAEQNIKNAEVSLEKAKLNLELIDDSAELSQKVKDAYNNIFIQLGNSLLTIFNGLQTADSVIGFDEPGINDDFEKYLTIDRQVWNNAFRDCPESMRLYDDADDYYQRLTITSPQNDIDQAIDLVDSAFLQIDKCLYSTRLVLESAGTAFDFKQSELDALVANVDTAKTSVRSGISTLESYKQALNSAINSYNLADQDYQAASQNLQTVTVESENAIASAKLGVKAKESSLLAAEADLNRLTSDPREVDLAGLRAEINRARANLNSASSSYRKTQIIAPVDGVVSKMEHQIGENVAAGAPMTAIITDSPQIDLDISETDIAKVELDDLAEVTLDAYGDDLIFQAKVIFIEPAETEIAGVIYYKIKLIFTEKSEKDIKPGMTANVVITTDKKENVLAVPHRAIISQNGKKIVRVLKNGNIEEVEVETGLKGDSNTEIVSGLSEGDEVITFIKNE
ncbi:MAG: efflux RND transporter periplasmic adaptor subunit [Patescibacteria group bacterium]